MPEIPRMGRGTSERWTMQEADHCRAFEGVLLAEIMTCEVREGEERKEGEECDGPGGMSLVPAPHDILQVLLSCRTDAGSVQDQRRIHAGATRKRWPCNADHPVVVTRAWPLA